MPPGDLLFESNTKQQGEALLGWSSASYDKVSVTPRFKLDTVQEVISDDDLLETSDVEIVEGLFGQGIVATRRITLR